MHCKLRFNSSNFAILISVSSIHFCAHVRSLTLYILMWIILHCIQYMLLPLLILFTLYILFIFRYLLAFILHVLLMLTLWRSSFLLLNKFPHCGEGLFLFYICINISISFGFSNNAPFLLHLNSNVSKPWDYLLQRTKNYKLWYQRCITSTGFQS